MCDDQKIFLLYCVLNFIFLKISFLKFVTTKTLNFKQIFGLVSHVETWHLSLYLQPFPTNCLNHKAPGAFPVQTWLPSAFHLF